MSGSRLVGPDGMPFGKIGSSEGSPGLFAARLSGRPSLPEAKNDAGEVVRKAEPRDRVLEAEFVLRSGDDFVRTAILLQNMAVALRGRADCANPILKIRLYVDAAAVESATLWMLKIVETTGGVVIRTFEGPASGDNPGAGPTSGGSGAPAT